MPRKTGYHTRSSTSTLKLGDPDVGTATWGTEYDTEFMESFRREQRAAEQTATASRRNDLRTPRSLKKGFVHNDDYEKLDSQYAASLSAYRDLEMQLGQLEQRLDTVHGSEALFMRAVSEQNELVDTLQHQVAGLTDSLGRLLGNVERSKGLMSLMSTLQEAPPAQVVTGNKMMHESDVSRRLSSLESKLGDMAAAITTLSATQARTLGTLKQQTNLLRQSTSGGPGGPGGRAGLRAVPEDFEKLPNPTRLTSSQGFWKP
ncbi:hypothetical protein HXX76_003939 [Chlamydomonas incerta]|uniref:Uncharacterized protein n=1 Tax=Chlamydomonas incerta TaxID=51695 RepID=A0A835W9A3_CHLIN|nr:hypothetical protein HXX76_003939 [Chlamydomonas incerta]|eukprot:KAG2441086.1 hypothetical protein HXX76_003939 [Chlamydomonas incerta]